MPSHTKAERAKNKPQKAKTLIGKRKSSGPTKATTDFHERKKKKAKKGKK